MSSLDGHDLCLLLVDQLQVQGACLARVAPAGSGTPLIVAQAHRHDAPAAGAPPGDVLDAVLAGQPVAPADGGWHGLPVIGEDGCAVGALLLHDTHAPSADPHRQRLLAWAAVAARSLFTSSQADAVLPRALRLVGAAWDTLRELVCVHDAEGRLLSVNRATVAFFGAGEAADLIGRTLDDFVVPEVRGEVAQYLHRIARDGFASGHFHVRTTRGVAILEYQNTAVSACGVHVVLGVSRDVTAREMAERQERRLDEAVTRVSPLGVFQTDLEGNLTHVSDRYRELTDTTPDAPLDAAAWRSRVHPDDREAVWAEWDAARRERRAWHAEYRVGRTGDPRWVRGVASPVTTPGGDISGYVGTLTDVTEQRTMTEALRRSESRLREAQQLARLGYWEWLPDSDTFWCSHELCELVCMPADAPVTPSMAAFLASVHPDDRRLVDEAIADARRGVKTQVQHRLTTLAGTELIVNTRATLRRTQTGAAGVAGVVQDVTDRVHLERDLRERDAMLRQGQKMQALGQLAGGVAHDFNNVLAVIIGYAETITAHQDPRVQTAGGQIMRAGERAAQLTRQLLAFTRKQLVDVHTIDVTRSVLDMEAMVGRLLGRHVVLRTSYASGALPVNIGVGQFDQVLLNLVVNSRDAMPEGGTITISTSRMWSDGTNGARVPRGAYAQLTVEDTGCGMSAETLARIFDPFFTTKPVGKGTGLGLSTVIGIVEQYGGRVDVSSTPGSGTTFVVLLPLAGETAADAPTVVEPGAEARHPLVLVVDDDDQVRELVEQMLVDGGYAVQGFADGPAAVAAVRNGDLQPEGLICDVRMRGAEGPAVVRAVLAEAPATGVVLMSGYLGDANAGELTAHPRVRLLAKPFSPKALLEALTAARG